MYKKSKAFHNFTLHLLLPHRILLLFKKMTPEKDMSIAIELLPKKGDLCQYLKCLLFDTCSKSELCVRIRG